MMSFAQQRMNIMNTSMQNAMDSVSWGANAQLQGLQNMQSRQDQWNQWWQQYQADEQKTAASNAMKQAEMANDDYWKQLNYDLDAAKTAYDINKPYYNPNSGGGGGNRMTAGERQNAYLADAYAGVDEAVASGRTHEEISQNIMSKYPDLVRLGVDPQRAIEYLYERYPETSGSGNWYNKLDQKLGGWLPFGASRSR
jgi:hypothetical protein